jgi:hypothetical protein
MNEPLEGGNANGLEKTALAYTERFSSRLQTGLLPQETPSQPMKV